MLDDGVLACRFDPVMLVWTAAARRGLVPATSFVLNWLLA